MYWMSYLPEPVTALIPMVIQYTNEEDVYTESEEECSDEEEEEEDFYSSEEEETEEEEEEEDEDIVTDEEESDEESCLEDEEMHSEEDTSDLISPIARTLPPIHPRQPLAPPQNAGRRIVTITVSSDEEDEDLEEEESDDEQPVAYDRRRPTILRWSSGETFTDSDDRPSDDDSSIHLPDSSDEEISDDEREQREAEDAQREVSASTSLLGACTICHEDDVVEPTMCKKCKNVVGCYTCVARWMRAREDPQCPLCREKWTENVERAIPVRLMY